MRNASLALLAAGVSLQVLAACDDLRPSDAGSPLDAGPPLDAASSRPGRDAGEIGGTCETGCTGFSYCDPFSGECRPGCGDDTACGDLELCDLVDRECVCARGAHACGAACVSDADPATCGDRCAPCPGADHGSAACVAGQCAVACDPGYQACGDACVACPTLGVARTSCRDSACVVEACAEGYGPCASGCCAFEHAAVTSPSSGAVFVSAAVFGGEVHLVTSSSLEVQAWFRGRPDALRLEADRGWGIELRGPAAILPPGVIVGIGQGATTAEALVTYRRSGSSWARGELPSAGGRDFDQLRCAPAAAGGGTCLFTSGFPVYAAQISSTGVPSRPPLRPGEIGADWELAPEDGQRDARIRVDSSGRIHSLFLAHRETVYRSTRGQRDNDPNAVVVTPSDPSSAQASELVLGPGGEPHLLIGGGRMGHVRRVGGAWRTEALDLVGHYARRIEAEADASGHLHVALLEGAGGVTYAHFDGARWAVSQVEARTPADLDLVLFEGRPVIVTVDADSRTGFDRVNTYRLP